MVEFGVCHNRFKSWCGWPHPSLYVVAKIPITTTNPVSFLLTKLRNQMRAQVLWFMPRIREPGRSFWLLFCGGLDVALAGVNKQKEGLCSRFCLSHTLLLCLSNTVLKAFQRALDKDLIITHLDSLALIFL